MMHMHGPTRIVPSTELGVDYKYAIDKDLIIIITNSKIL